MKEIKQEFELAKEGLIKAQQIYLKKLKDIRSRCPHIEYQWERIFNEYDCSTEYHGTCTLCEHEIFVEWGDELFYKVNEKYWESE